MNEDHREVIVVDIKMHFWSMVVFMVKWAIASIPALIILAVLLSVLLGLMGSLGRLHGPGFRM
jgi:hypothetical protein